MAEKIKKPLSKAAKQCICIGVVFAVIFGMLGGLIAYLTVNQNVAYSKIIIACMPEKITGTDNNKKIDFYIEYNKDFDKKNDEPINAYRVYYKDDNGKRIDLPAGHYQSRTADMQVLLGFFAEGQKNITAMKNVIIVIVVLIFGAFICFLVYIWYLLWRNKQIKKQEQSKEYNNKAYLSDFDDDKK